VSFYTSKIEMGLKGVILYQREGSPNWYVRLPKPAPLKGYKNISLKTTDLVMARQQAMIVWGEHQSSSSLYDKTKSWDGLFDRYFQEGKEHKAVSIGHLKRVKGFWNRYLRPFIVERRISSIESFTADTIVEFYEWRRDFWLNQASHPPNAKVNPKASTLRVEMNTAAHLLRLFYHYNGMRSPDFQLALSRVRRRSSKNASRTEKSRGFALSLEHYKKLVNELGEWAKEDCYRAYHKFARERLYYVVRFCFHTRARPGTEISFIRMSHLAVTKDEKTETFTIHTEGKLHGRRLLLDQSFYTGIRTWLMKQQSPAKMGGYLEMLGEHKDPYLFPGSVNGKPGGQHRLNARRLQVLFKKFLEEYASDDVKYHPASITGRSGVEAVPVVLYDIRNTAITQYILGLGKSQPLATIAELCGTSVGTIDKHYTQIHLQNSPSKFVGDPNIISSPTAIAHEKARVAVAKSLQELPAKIAAAEKAKTGSKT